jgi:hypothetical protein
MTLTNIHGNLRYATNHYNYYAYQKPSALGHKQEWINIFSADNLNDFRKLARQHCCQLIDENPRKFTQLLAPLN